MNKMYIVTNSNVCITNDGIPCIWVDLERAEEYTKNVNEHLWDDEEKYLVKEVEIKIKD